MARIFKVTDLEARRRALAAESEVYRQALTLEIQNLRLYAARQQRTYGGIVSGLASSAPILKLLMPLVAMWMRRRRHRRRGKWSRLIGLAAMGWQAYSRFGPMIRSVVSLPLRRRPSGMAEAGSRRY